MKHQLLSFILILISFSSIDSFGQFKSDESSGNLFLNPLEIKRTKQIKQDAVLISYHQKGFVETKEKDSPWYESTFFVQGSIVEDSSENILQEVALFETLDRDGDLSWGTFWTLPDGTIEVELKMGTGKWKNITGKGKLTPVEYQRVDGGKYFLWNISWQVDYAEKRNPESSDFEGKYQYHDSGLSFHGPHIHDFSNELSNGTTLLVSNQSGVLLSDDKNAISPRNFATCYDRGTTFIKDGKVQGDVMLLEDTDPDGDIVWLYHEWWYNKGPGKYEFIGGIGKWEGISGVGITRGMLRKRTDDHFMLKSEMFWNMKE